MAADISALVRSDGLRPRRRGGPRPRRARRPPAGRSTGPTRSTASPSSTSPTPGELAADGRRPRRQVLALAVPPAARPARAPRRRRRRGLPGLLPRAADLRPRGPRSRGDRRVRARLLQPRRAACGFNDYRADTVDAEHDEVDHAAGNRLGMPVLALWGADGVMGTTLPILDLWREYADDVRGRALERCGHFLPRNGPMRSSTSCARSWPGQDDGGDKSGTPVETDPTELGFDPARLRRIDEHFARYVDAGGSPGWLAVRRPATGRSRTSHRRPAATSRPSAVELDTLFRIYSMTKPITSVAAMMLYEEGAFELKDPVRRFIPAFADMRVYAGAPRWPVTEPGSRTGPRVAPAHAHRGPHLRLPPRPPRRRDVPERRLRVGHPRPVSTSPRAATCGPRCRCCSNQGPSGTTACRPTSSVVSSRSVSGQTLDDFFAERIFGPLGMDDTAFSSRRATHGPLGRAVHADTGDGQATRMDAMGERAQVAARYLSGGWRPGVDRRPTTTGSRRCCSAAASSTGCGCSAPRTVRLHDAQPPARRRRPRGVRSAAVRGDDLRRRRLRPRVLGRRGPGSKNKVLGQPASTRGAAPRAPLSGSTPEDITAVFITQLLPSSTHPIRSQLRRPLAYQALVD